MKVIQSERHLAWALGVPIARLRKIADTPAANYHEFFQYKDATKTKGRIIRNPKDEPAEIPGGEEGKKFLLALRNDLLTARKVKGKDGKEEEEKPKVVIVVGPRQLPAVHELATPLHEHSKGSVEDLAVQTAVGGAVGT